jgi:cytochrome c5
MAVQKISRWASLGMLACLSAQPSLAATEAPIDGMALYQKHCAACHEGKVPRAPHMITFLYYRSRGDLDRDERGRDAISGVRLVRY